MLLENLFRNKKGFVYLLTSIIIIAILIIVFLMSHKYEYQDKQDLHQSKILQMNDFILGFEEDVHRSSYISSFRTLLVLEDEIAISGSFFNDTEEVFKEAFYYGTINGEEVDLMNDSSFEDYLERVNGIAHDMGFSVDIQVTEIELNQSAPFIIDVILHMSINCTDSSDLAYWLFNKTYYTKVPIYDLRDPLYSTFTDNKVPNTVRILNTSFLVNQSNNDTSNLITLINESYYVESSFAPTFLMRFENNNSPDPNGIESVVNIAELSLQDIDVYPNRVKIDYIYFNNLPSDKICDADYIPEEYHMVLPSNREAIYELTQINYSSSCP